jgi:ABC-type multidrug transport system fused ATPase/permease subunit
VSNSEKKNALLYLFGSTWKYSVGNRKNVVWYWVMFIIAESVDTIFSPLIWAKMIQVVTVQGINATSMKTLYVCLGLLLSRTLVSWSFHGPARCIERNNAFKVRANHWRYLLKGVITLPLEWHVEHHTGDTIDKVSNNCSFITSSLGVLRSDHTLREL